MASPECIDFDDIQAEFSYFERDNKYRKTKSLPHINKGLRYVRQERGQRSLECKIVGQECRIQKEQEKTNISNRFTRSNAPFDERKDRKTMGNSQEKCPKNTGYGTSWKIPGEFRERRSAVTDYTNQDLKERTELRVKFKRL